MINIRLVRDKDGFIWNFAIQGHAGYGRKGSDIVCSAVSAVAYTALGALEELAGISNYSEEDGFMRCTIPADVDNEAKYKIRIILETMAIGLKQIEQAYKRYVSVVDEEV